MAQLNYKIEFFSEWHCGAGLAAGANIDQLVIKDSNGLPFIPGKTIKGLLRESLEYVNKELVIMLLGTESRKAGEEDSNEGKGSVAGCCYFSNSELPEAQREYIVRKELTDFLYKTVTSTAIGPNGVAKEHSLRKMQTVVPCTLVGQIENIPEKRMSNVETALKLIKRLGQNRNRGLGRCNFEVITLIDEK